MPIKRTRKCRCGVTVTAEGLSKETADDRALDKLWNHYADNHAGAAPAAKESKG